MKTFLLVFFWVACLATAVAYFMLWKLHQPQNAWTCVWPVLTATLGTVALRGIK